MSIEENNPPVSEARDTERAITVWRAKAGRLHGIPALTALNVCGVISDLGYRFVISCDEVAEDATFLLYGAQFARLLGLPDLAASFVPMIRQLLSGINHYFSRAVPKLFRSENRFSSVEQFPATRHANFIAPFLYP
jgi:hypothetical protein